ncbi:hypothetical protein JKP88DRAFT_275833 [Tribonema minus]|uniref:AN1-type domain-containing protein n=1 Tax=Tribonema minus TaxID=303371 RepID=A0A835Z8W5_9STRA|nr:hypothetical protein JKP88DRAFT_275833 [Tribonema minus]
MAVICRGRFVVTGRSPAAAAAAAAHVPEAAAAAQRRESAPSAASPGRGAGGGDPPARPRRARPRCAVCGRRTTHVDLVVGCRCGLPLCAAHRLPAAHGCGFDYRTLPGSDGVAAPSPSADEPRGWVVGAR